MKMSVEVYCDLWQPSWDWILHVYAQCATQEHTMGVLREYATISPPGQDGAQKTSPGGGIVLESILANMPPAHLSSVAVQLVTLINEEVACQGESGSSGSKKMHLYGLLGRCLVSHPPPEEHRRPLLNEVNILANQLFSSMCYRHVLCN